MTNVTKIKHKRTRKREMCRCEKLLCFAYLRRDILLQRPLQCFGDVRYEVQYCVPHVNYGSNHRCTVPPFPREIKWPSPFHPFLGNSSTTQPMPGTTGSKISPFSCAWVFPTPIYRPEIMWQESHFFSVVGELWGESEGEE